MDFCRTWKKNWLYHSKCNKLVRGIMSSPINTRFRTSILETIDYKYDWESTIIIIVVNIIILYQPVESIDGHSSSWSFGYYTIFVTCIQFSFKFITQRCRLSEPVSVGMLVHQVTLLLLSISISVFSPFFSIFGWCLSHPFCPRLQLTLLPHRLIAFSSSLNDTLSHIVVRCTGLYRSYTGCMS